MERMNPLPNYSVDAIIAGHHNPEPPRKQTKKSKKEKTRSRSNSPERSGKDEAE
jgi:hypothetical protein